jgi:hypothetical protein
MKKFILCILITNSLCGMEMEVEYDLFSLDTLPNAFSNDEIFTEIDKYFANDKDDKNQSESSSMEKHVIELTPIHKRPHLEDSSSYTIIPHVIELSSMKYNSDSNQTNTSSQKLKNPAIYSILRQLTDSSKTDTSNFSMEITDIEFTPKPFPSIHRVPLHAQFIYICNICNYEYCSPSHKITEDAALQHATDSRCRTNKIKIISPSYLFVWLTYCNFCNNTVKHITPWDTIQGVKRSHNAHIRKHTEQKFKTDDYIRFVGYAYTHCSIILK